MTYNEPISTAVVRALAEHRLMTTRQLQDYAAPGRSRQRLSQILTMLTGLKMIESVNAYVDGGLGATKQWYLTERGRHEAHNLPELRADAIAVVTEATARAQTQRHTLAVNSTGIAIQKAGEARGHDVTWRHEVTHRFTDARKITRANSLTSDAALTVEGVKGTAHPVTYLVELDRATQPLHVVLAKVRAYITYRNFRRHGTETPAWTEDYPLDLERPYQGFPTLLFVFAGKQPSVAENRRDELAHLLADPDDDLLAQAGDPVDGIWTLLTTLHDLTRDNADAYGLHYLNPHHHLTTDPFGNTAPLPVALTAHAG